MTSDGLAARHVNTNAGRGLVVFHLTHNEPDGSDEPETVLLHSSVRFNLRRTFTPISFEADDAVRGPRTASIAIIVNEMERVLL